MESRYIVVLITVPTPEEGRKIAEHLVENKLAACVNILPSIQSCYIWDGKTNLDQEILLLVKTRADLFEDRIIPAVQALHPYELPEIIALPIVLGSQRYLEWIESETV
jgi:periplasmic divalent cation tolerance protein